MKNLTLPAIAFLAVLILSGCEKTFNGIVDEENPAYKVLQINSFSTFNYAIGDSLLPLRVTFSDDQGVTNVFADVFDPDGDKLNSSAIMLADNGKAESGDDHANDKVYSGVFPMKQSYANGKYSVNYYLVIKPATKQIASHSFEYDNGQTNEPPVIDNASAPDTLVVNTRTVFDVHVHVTDPNGQNDIKKVYFTVFKPNGSITSLQPVMMDNGDDQFGDVIAGDSIYSARVEITETSDKGTYRLEFVAQDRRNASSNKINHLLVIK